MPLGQKRAKSKTGRREEEMDVEAQDDGDRGDGGKAMRTGWQIERERTKHTSD